MTAGFRVKVSAFEKCSCCGDCYIMFFSCGPNWQAMAAMPVYFKRHAFALLEGCRNDDSINEAEYRFFGAEIANSSLPENPPSLQARYHLDSTHMRNPKVRQGIMAGFELLHFASQGNSPKH